jgi:hypothetical protein
MNGFIDGGGGKCCRWFHGSISESWGLYRELMIMRKFSGEIGVGFTTFIYGACVSWFVYSVLNLQDGDLIFTEIS